MPKTRAVTAPAPAPLPFATARSWRDWLAAHHSSAAEVWLLYHRKGTGTASLDWNEAVEEALAWGWIDGLRRTVDETRWMQRFTPRRPKGTWSLKNRITAERLIAEGRMQPAGLAQVRAAQADGRWDAAYEGGLQAGIPQDFLDALAQAPPSARETFGALDGRNLYAIYHRLITARRPETRASRIEGFIARLARREGIL